MNAEEIRDRLAATFDHEPTEVHTSKGPTGQVCCGHCFVNWPCPAVRKIGRVMVPAVRRLIADELLRAADEQNAEARRVQIGKGSHAGGHDCAADHLRVRAAEVLA